MTALLAILSADGQHTDDRVVARMLGRMGSRGGSRALIWRDREMVIAVTRHEWEFSEAFSGPSLVVQDGDFVVVADASLYYRDDLRRKLTAKGVRPKGDTASHLVLAAYQAFGEKCPEILEGDFAFIIWNRATQTVFWSRDHAGQRPLFYAEFGGSLVVSSTIGAFSEHPAWSAELDLVSVALDAAGLIFSGSDETCYRGLFTARAGYSYSKKSAARAQSSRWWNPSVVEPSRPSSAEEAAEELLRLLGTAVTERLDSGRRTAIWLSGGCDSTALFAAGRHQMARRGIADRLQPVSVSYPVGDPGREDERIKAVAEMWNTSIKWLDIADVPLFEPSPERAAQRCEPYAHVFEQWMRKISNASRETGARVALTGHGGDCLFQSSPVYLADVLAKGRLVRLSRELRALGVETNRMRYIFNWAIQPLLPDSLLSLAGWIRGRHLRGHFERPIPRWIREDFATRNQIRERTRAGSPRTRRGSRAAHEMYWYLTEPLYPRLSALIAGYALEEGIEIRNPFYDKRVIDFAASRPHAERNSLGERKRLLRQAMRALLPDDVLTPRAVKPGTLAGYFETSMRAAAPMLEQHLEKSVLAELGVVDLPALQRSLGIYMHGRESAYVREQLYFAVQTELWLRANRRGPATMASEVKELVSSGASEKVVTTV